MGNTFTECCLQCGVSCGCFHRKSGETYLGIKLLYYVETNKSWTGKMPSNWVPEEVHWFDNSNVLFTVFRFWLHTNSKNRIRYETSSELIFWIKQKHCFIYCWHIPGLDWLPDKWWKFGWNFFEVHKEWSLHQANLINWLSVIRTSILTLYINNRNEQRPADERCRYKRLLKHIKWATQLSTWIKLFASLK